MIKFGFRRFFSNNIKAEATKVISDTQKFIFDVNTY